MSMKRRTREALQVLALTAATVLFFSVWPQADIAFSGLFHDSGSGFLADGGVVVPRLHRLVPVLGWILCGTALGVLVWARWRPASLCRPTCRDACALALATVVGLGLVINLGLKEQIGRPRPAQVQPFGGPHDFVPAFVAKGPCHANCSFVSGHAATGFALMAVGSLSGLRRRRRTWLRIGIVAGLGLGLVRVAQGGHFLSDILFAGWVMYAQVQLVRWCWLVAVSHRRRRMADTWAHEMHRSHSPGLVDAGVHVGDQPAGGCGAIRLHHQPGQP